MKIVLFKVFLLFAIGNNHLVPILIPKDTVGAMEMLADPDIRRTVGINASNIYAFPSTRNSEDHVSGWHAMHTICDMLPLKQPKNIKATANRRRVSTVFATLELTPSERQLFFKHMGHSGAINENIYQNPLAIEEITKVGKALLAIDKQGLCRGFVISSN